MLTLYSIKAKKPQLFKSAVIFRKVAFIFECHTIRLPVRQRIIDMFDKDVLRQMVLDENSDEEESQPDTARPMTARYAPQ
jgi:rapamycin-insensitive companion of mTOR